MHSGTLVNRPAGLIISSLGSFAFLVLNRIADIGNKGRLHLPLWTRKHKKREIWEKVSPKIFLPSFILSFYILPCGKKYF